MTTMAGTEAELELLWRSCGADRNDREEIERLLKGDQKTEVRLRKMTAMLVKRHHKRIYNVANALIHYGKLDADEIDTIVDWHRST
jgi:hypothetical protein